MGEQGIARGEFQTQQVIEREGQQAIPRRGEQIVQELVVVFLRRVIHAGNGGSEEILQRSLDELREEPDRAHERSQGGQEVWQWRRRPRRRGGGWRRGRRGYIHAEGAAEIQHREREDEKPQRRA